MHKHAKFAHKSLIVDHFATAFDDANQTGRKWVIQVKNILKNNTFRSIHNRVLQIRDATILSSISINLANKLSPNFFYGVNVCWRAYQSTFSTSLVSRKSFATRDEWTAAFSSWNPHSSPSKASLLELNMTVRSLCSNVGPFFHLCQTVPVGGWTILHPKSSQILVLKLVLNGLLISFVNHAVLYFTILTV